MTLTIENIKIALEKSGLAHEIHIKYTTSAWTEYEIGIKFSEKTPVWDWFDFSNYNLPDEKNFLTYSHGYSQNIGVKYGGWKRKWAAYNRFEKVTGLKR